MHFYKPQPCPTSECKDLVIYKMIRTGKHNTPLSVAVILCLPLLRARSWGVVAHQHPHAEALKTLGVLLSLPSQMHTCARKAAPLLWQDPAAYVVGSVKAGCVCAQHV